jgi:hypothetical protein
LVVFAHAQDVLTRRTPDGFVVLGPTPPAVVLRGTAALLWEAFAAPKCVDDVVEVLARSYDEPRDAVREQTMTFVQSLVDASLLTTVPTASADACARCWPIPEPMHSPRSRRSGFRTYARRHRFLPPSSRPCLLERLTSG